MSIAAITSSFVTAVRERAAPASSAPAEPVANVQEAPKSGRRHQLVDAMQQVLGGDSVDSKSDQQVVFRFAHALMHDLRKIETGAEGATSGAGRAWGRGGYSDLPQRLEALATASAKPAAPPPAALTSAPATALPATALSIRPVPPTAPKAPFSTVDVAPDVPAADLPVQPNPLTATSAALHLMQVPTSRLLEAYAALRQALGDSEPAPAAVAAPPPTATPYANRTALADFLTRLSTSLASDAPATLPAGSLLNLRA